MGVAVFPDRAVEPGLIWLYLVGGSKAFSIFIFFIPNYCTILHISQTYPKLDSFFAETAKWDDNFVDSPGNTEGWSTWTFGNC